MFRITEDPSSGSPVQCLAKNYKNDSIVSVDMDKVGVMAAHSDPLCVCVVHTQPIYSELHARTTQRLTRPPIKTKLRGLSPHANYTDRAAAAGRRS